MTDNDEDTCLAAMDIWQSVPGCTQEKLAARTHRPTDSSSWALRWTEPWHQTL